MKRILFWVRPDFEQFPGGDSLQALQMGRVLKELGYEVTVSSDFTLELTPYDVIQIWHLERIHDSYYYFERAKRAGKMVILVDTYCPENFAPPGSGAPLLKLILKENLKNLLRLPLCLRDRKKFFLCIYALKTGWWRARLKMLDGADLHIVNSHTEERIVRASVFAPIRIALVHNIADAERENTADAEKKYDLVCCGHFCPRKNQLALIRALKRTSRSVLFIGGARPAHWRYWKRCLKFRSGKFRFTGKISHAECLNLLKESRVHVCVSSVETPGLANLEAALFGCNLVLPENPVLREYFGDDAFYFSRPGAPDFYEAVENALSAPPSEKMIRRVAERYSAVTMRNEIGEIYRNLPG